MQLLESLTVRAECYTEVASSINLESGKEYFILATGTYIYNDHDNYADAEWIDRVAYWEETPPVGGWCCTIAADLQINGLAIDWMGSALDSPNPTADFSTYEPHVFSPSHTYWTSITGEGQPVRFAIRVYFLQPCAISCYPSGSLDVHIFGTSPKTVPLDIKPGSCPNPLNVKDKGALPVAILGTGDFDVTTIDVASVRLQGVAPIRSALEDVATPVAAVAPECACTSAGPDGYLDLRLKFDVQAIVAALGNVNDGDEVRMTLAGALLESHGGGPIEGADCVVILSKGNKK